MSPAIDSTRALSAADVAREMGEPEPTVRRWLRVWHAQGVAGIERVPSRGRYGCRYLVDPSLVERWRACTLPAPHASAA